MTKDTVIHTAVFNKSEHRQPEEKYSYMRNPVSRRDINIIREEIVIIWIRGGKQSVLMR